MPMAYLVRGYEISRCSNYRAAIWIYGSQHLRMYEYVYLLAEFSNIHSGLFWCYGVLLWCSQLKLWRYVRKDFLLAVRLRDLIKTYQ